MAIYTYLAPSVVDAPAPEPWQYSIATTALTNPEGDDRWLNGVQFAAGPYGKAGTWDECGAVGIGPDNASTAAKTWRSVFGMPEFGTFAVVVAAQCSAFTIHDETEEEYRLKTAQLFAAVQYEAVEREFWNGRLLPGQPHLSDATTTTLLPAGGTTGAPTATTPTRGVAALENWLAWKSGRRGTIHMSPGIVSVLGMINLNAGPNGQILTRNNNYVATGAGYVAGRGPGNVAAPSDPAVGTGQEWLYATTGRLVLRQSEIISWPTELFQAVDRSVNDTTLIAERYFNVSWDGGAKAAVLVDRNS